MAALRTLVFLITCLPVSALAVQQYGFRVTDQQPRGWGCWSGTRKPYCCTARADTGRQVMRKTRVRSAAIFSVVSYILLRARSRMMKRAGATARHSSRHSGTGSPQTMLASSSAASGVEVRPREPCAVLRYSPGI